MTSKDNFIVKAGETRYPVIFSPTRKKVATLVKESAKIVIISNPTVFALHGKRFIDKVIPHSKECHKIMIGDGEKYKTIQTINKLYDHFFDIGLSRKDTIITLGGGIVGDTGGFAAATFKRGVNLIQAPTTVLAMVDSSIGGKVGVNHALGKNLIGAFFQPQAVIVNPDWLSTLGNREIIDGFAEIIKTGFLSGPPFIKSIFSLKSDDFIKPTKNLLKLIKKSMRFKASIVARDAHESDLRRILNFGHTFGHAIEKVEGFGRYRHGEAVLAGMIGALHLSHATGNLRSKSMNEALDAIEPLVSHLNRLKNDIPAYLSPMRVDKKNENGKQIFVLLKDIGRPHITEVKSKQKISEAIRFMREYVNNRSGR
ncbi:MAG: 3-dehydroquinate synthase [candidate division Zixibacteria bacterium]